MSNVRAPNASSLVDRLVGRWARRRASRTFHDCDAVGPGARVFGAPHVVNDGCLEIGDDFMISAIPVRGHLVTATSGRLRIGHRVRIGHGTSIFAQELIEIGDGTTIGPMTMVLDVDFHEVKDRGSLGTARPIRIGKNVRIASGVVVLRGAVIGDGARIAAGSVVSRAIPAGVHAEGVPARPTPPRDERLVVPIT